jgi:hypothetical protein
MAPLRIASLVGELPNDLANFASELANRRFRSLTRAAIVLVGRAHRLASALKSTETNFSPSLLTTRAARALLIQALSSGSTAGTVDQHGPPEIRQLGCQSRQLSRQATPPFHPSMSNLQATAGPSEGLRRCCTGDETMTGL